MALSNAKVLIGLMSPTAQDTVGEWHGCQLHWCNGKAGTATLSDCMGPSAFLLRAVLSPDHHTRKGSIASGKRKLDQATSSGQLQVSLCFPDVNSPFDCAAARRLPDRRSSHAAQTCKCLSKTLPASGTCPAVVNYPHLLALLHTQSLRLHNQCFCILLLLALELWGSTDRGSFNAAGIASQLLSATTEQCGVVHQD